MTDEDAMVSFGTLKKMVRDGVERDNRGGLGLSDIVMETNEHVIGELALLYDRFRKR